MLPLLVSASPRRVQGVSGAPSPRVPPQNPARGRARAPVSLLWRSLQPRARPHGDCRLHSNLIHSHSDILSRVLASSPWRRSASPKLGTQRDIDDLRCLCVQVITLSTAPAVASFLVLQARCARASATPVCAPCARPARRAAAGPVGVSGLRVCAADVTTEQLQQILQSVQAELERRAALQRGAPESKRCVPPLAVAALAPPWRAFAARAGTRSCAPRARRCPARRRCTHGRCSCCYMAAARTARGSPSRRSSTSG